MGVAYFIVLERDIEGLDSEVDGKLLAQNADALDRLASELGVRPISEFISTDPEDAAAFMEDEGVDAGEVELPPLQQFSATDGLATVRALRAHSESSLAAGDLRDFERVLSVAEEHGVGWHVEVDF